MYNYIKTLGVTKCKNQGQRRTCSVDAFKAQYLEKYSTSFICRPTP